MTSTSPLKNFLDATSAQVVLAQEVKTSGPTSDSLRDWARRNGWKVLFADSDYRPDTDAHSVGVAIFAREWLGFRWPPGCGPTTKGARVVIGMLECPSLPAIMLASTYLKTGIGGATPYNLGLFKFVGQTASEHRMPWIMGGDYKVSPHAMNETMFPQTAGAQILADLTPIGTCDSAHGVSTID